MAPLVREYFSLRLVCSMSMPIGSNSSQHDNHSFRLSATKKKEIQVFQQIKTRGSESMSIPNLCESSVP